MKRIKRGSLVLVFLGISAIAVLSATQVSSAATREENIKKIEAYLGVPAVAESLEAKGGSPEKMIGHLNAFSDSQLETLAETANMQIGGALDDSGAAEFWQTWGVLLLLVTVLPVILLLAAV